MYYTRDGEIVTHGQIQRAFEAGKARLVHGHRDASQYGGLRVSTGLMLDGKDFDTRDNCDSVWEELWTRKPETLQECLEGAN
jgi:hypothetical protein